MKEIKFRNFNNKTKEVIYFNLEDIQDEYHEANHSSFENVMQYTGLKDKNGVEIYEGDILSHLVYNKWKSADVVSYNNEKAMFELLHKGEPHKPKDILKYLLESEIIGNIYENKELLENNE